MPAASNFAKLDPREWQAIVDYVKGNFLNGRSFADFTNLNAQALHWLNHTANVRLHATTKEQPVVLFAREELTQVSSMVPYEVGLQVQRQAAWDATVRFDRSRITLVNGGASPDGEPRTKLYRIPPGADNPAP